MSRVFAFRELPKITGKVGSTNFINYAEITLRIFPATAMIL